MVSHLMEVNQSCLIICFFFFSVVFHKNLSDCRSQGLDSPSGPQFLSFFSRSLGTISMAPSTIGITVTCIFQNFYYKYSLNKIYIFTKLTRSVRYGHSPLIKNVTKQVILVSKRDDAWTRCVPVAVEVHDNINASI